MANIIQIAGQIGATVGSAISTITNTSSSANNSALSSVGNSIGNIIGGVTNTANAISNQLLAQINANITNGNNALQSALGNVSSSISASSIQAMILNTQTQNSIKDELRKTIIASETNIRSFAITQENLMREAFIKATNEGKVLNKTIADSISNSNKSMGEAFREYAEKGNIQTDKLGNRLREALEANTESIQGWGDNIFTDIREGTQNFFVEIFDYLASRVDSINTVLSDLERGDYDSLEAFRNDLFGDERVGSLAGSIWSLVMFLPLLKDILSASNAKFYTRLNELSLRDSTPQRYNETLAKRAIDFGLMNYEQFEDELAVQGWSKDRIRELYELLQNVPDMTTQYELYRRGFIDAKQLKAGFSILGYNEAYHDSLENLAWFQPTPNDVIRFVVRDVFDERLAALGNIFEGWDNPDYLDYAAKAGVTPEVAKLFWGAHWQVPSPTQGYEMLHRGIINQEELAALLKSADYAPAWQQKLIDISYNVPTRVDTRRMFEMGVIEENEVFSILKAQGYDDRYATMLLNWYKQLKNTPSAKEDEIKKLSISTIVTAFNNGVLQYPEAISRLNELGYNNKDASIILANKIAEQNERLKTDYTKEIRARFKSLAEKGYRARTIDKATANNYLVQAGVGKAESEALLTLVDLEYQFDRKSELISAIRQAWLSYEVDTADIMSIMSKEGFTSAEIDKHLKELEPFRELRYKDLSVSDIKKAYQKGVIKLEEAVRQLRSNGYSDKDLVILLSLYFDDSEEE